MFRSGFANASSYRAAGKVDRLLRAAVTSFCANPRPTRREAAQFDDLAGPLLASASEETLRFMTASLSESTVAPPALIRRLADLPIEISAPLVMRSPILTPIDLLALIARHGLGHARAIAKRPGLEEPILLITRTLENAERKQKPASVKEIRQRLRAMMEPATATKTARSTQQTSPRSPLRPQSLEQSVEQSHPRWQDEADTYRKLRSAALADTHACFHSALARTLTIEPALARAIVEDPDSARLIVALRALFLSEEEAFLIMQCLHPVRNRHGVAAFTDAWRAVSIQDATRVAADWRKCCSASTVASDNHAPAGKLKAS